MIDQLIEAIPKVPELYVHLLFALLLAFFADQVVRLIKALRRSLPRIVIPKLKTALDLTNPFVVFALHLTAVLVALGIARGLGLV
ncbi:hypothetical protein ABZ464_23770 [Streptomyces sp. NPDC005820]|uniref:hypothetical protein n=1 Tax=Streptomyces sp. NPDC005820 TaxID=3157069 RepID=UPI0033D8D8BD